MEVNKTTPRSGRTTVSRAEQEVQAITLLLREANHVERTPRARKRVRRRIRILHRIWIHRGLQKNNAPLPALPDQPTASTSASEAYVQELVAALQDDECVLSSRAQKLVSEGPKPPTTSKDMHAAVEKLDQARNRFQAAQKARKNLQTIPGRHTSTRASKDGNRSLPTSARKTRIWKKG